MTGNGIILEGTELEPALILGRDRDAYATIRGFVLQVDLTIQRWLELGAGEELELERGEDIDRLSRGLLGSAPGDWDRLMEQVKRRDGAITLRSNSVRSALANFFEHHRRNPEVELRFRFTTNAPAGREKPSALPPRERGIEVWQRLAATEEYVAAQEPLLDAVRALLLGTRKPDDVGNESWEAWQAFVGESSGAELLAFIRRVEIATRTAESGSLRQAIEEKLQRDGHARDADHARDLYKTLFASVFARLSVRGIKRLTKEDLEAEFAGSGPGSSDRALVAKLDALRAFVEERIARLEEGLTDVRTEVGALATAVVSRRIPPGAHAGDTRSFQRTANYFGAELDSSSTFNHARALIGRGDLLDRAVAETTDALTSGSGGIVVLGGTGGVGKSRVLIALAERLEQDHTASVMWIRDRATPDIDSLNELPDGPVVLFCDDAHRRSDLEAILNLSESRRDPTLIVLGTRPRGRDALRVAAFHAGVGWDRARDLGDLQDLARDDLLELVRTELGPDDKQWAEAVVQVTHGSTLVALVAARLLRTRRLNPGILAQDREADDFIFSGFEDEIYGRLGNEVDSALAKRTLELLAAIAPVSMSDERLIELAAEHLGTDGATVRRVVGVLQEAGVLREQRRGVRIIPDVLSDHILHRMLVAGGRATRAERSILDSMGTGVLANVLRNVGELDWQIHAAQPLDGTDTAVDVFSEVWARFTETFRAASNSERASYLERLRPVAGFQPAPVLALCEWIIENPHGDDSTQWGTTFPFDNVLAKVPTLLATVAEHEEYFDRALELLWGLGRDDRRELNPYPEHAIRALNDVVGYAPRRYVWRQERAIAALKRWTLLSGWSEHAHSPLGVAAAVLRTAMVEDRYDMRTSTISMTRYGVNAEVTRRPREEAIALLTDLALGAEPRGRIWAVEALLNALKPPESQFGHVVTDEEEEGFRLQYEAVFDGIERIAAESQDALVRVKLRDGLQWVPRQTHLTWKQDRARQLIDRFPENDETMLVRVWGRLFRDAWRPNDAYDRIRKLGEELTRKAAAHLLSEATDANGIITYLTAERRRFEAAHVYGDPAYVLAAIAEMRPEIAVELADWIVNAEETTAGADFASWLPVLLVMLRGRRFEDYSRILSRAVSSRRPELRWAAAGALARVGDPFWNDDEGSHARTLLADASTLVRAEAIEAIGRIPAKQRAEFVESIVIGGDQGVAKAVAELWAYRPAEQQVRLSVKEAKLLLDALVELPDLGDPLGELDQMLAVFAKWHPLLVLEFVLERARRETSNSAQVGEDGHARYDAIPYTGFHGVWGALQGAAEYPAIVRRLLQALAEETRTSSGGWRRGTMDVARRLMLWDKEVEEAIREWMNAGKWEEVALVDVLLADQPSLFVLTHRDFVTDLLIWARSCQAKERERIESALLASTYRTIEARRRGEVNQVDVRLRDEARTIAQELARGGTDRRSAVAFFETVAKEAERRLASVTERDERAFAEQLEWDDED